MKINMIQNAGIFPVLYEGETDEPNPFEGQNDGYDLSFAHLRITVWDELIGARYRGSSSSLPWPISAIIR